MNAGPYLILHKVRGEPAFDIAERTLIGSEEAWIVATSGHRAYPWKIWLLADLSDISDINSSGYHDIPSYSLGSVPLDWPDHYTQPPKARARDELVKDILDLNLTVEELNEALAAIRSTK